ncbi:MAG: ADP-forming succinate--CoA ligase subunit beta [Opitutales bacterium]|nr:ADP-forming succinate--CoA ligase subunit beta [Opitutales bacterium]
MNIHEYQAKSLFSRYGIETGTGVAVQEAYSVDQALDQFPDGKIVVKAQIHAGGRGKGTFKDGFKGGVHIAPDKKSAKEIALRMLGNTLVTHQTGSAGREVKTVYFTHPTAIEKEYYLALVMDRESSGPVLIASQEGGVDIEQVAEETPEKIVKIPVDPGMGVQAYHCRLLSISMGFNARQTQQAGHMLKRLYAFFMEKDCSLVEINPLVVTKDGNLEALDAKVNFEDNGLIRHEDIVRLRDLDEEDPKEVEASNNGLSYVALDGNIACLVNGAGLAMATMDIIKHFGGEPANFLDVGGGATTEQVTRAFQIILKDPQVEGILVNIFGGIMSCKTIAEGVVAAAKKVGLSLPLVVRLEGNEVAEGKALLEESGISLVPAESLSDAAKKIVEIVGNKDN